MNIKYEISKEQVKLILGGRKYSGVVLMEYEIGLESSG
jgi:hypothetical protein